jgi:hypothetical protein
MATNYYPSDKPTKAPTGYSSSKQNPVVAVAPRPIGYGQSVQQNIRNADFNADNMPFVSGKDLFDEEEAKAQTEADAIVASLGSGLGNAFGNVGKGSGTAVSASDKLARDKWERENAIAIEKLRQLQDYYSTGKYNQPWDELSTLLQNQNRDSTGAIQGNYQTGMQNIGQGYDTAQGMLNTGYSALDEYLKQNPNNPYANYQSSFTPSQNAMQQYLSAYGVDQSPVNQQVAAENISGQLGADTFAALNETLSKVAQQSDLSRLAESQMGRNYGSTMLGAQRAGYEANAANVQQQALNDLLTAINSGEFDIAKGRGTAKTNAEQAVIDATVPEVDNPANAIIAAAATKSPAVTRLVNQGATATNPALVKRIDAFVAKNPGATRAQVAKQFPKLAAVKPKAKGK